MYEVTNNSSRNFIFGDITIMPHIPVTVDETMKGIIETSIYSGYFTFVATETVPETEEA